ncbi:MAG: cytochrome-c peroxidase, partial [Myxococcota bacterium]
VFTSSGCPACHPAPDYTRAAPADVGTGGLFEVPSLVGVGRRLPVIHDGCAATLEQRFDPGCGGSAHGPALSDTDRADLVAFLDTL